MNKSIKIIAKREYVKIVTRPSFWIMILIVPILYMVLATIAGLSAESVEKKVAEEIQSSKNILIIDYSNIISDEFITEKFQRFDNKEEAVSKVQASEVDALFIYPEDIYESNKIEIYAQDTSLISRDRFNGLATYPLRQSILSEVNDNKKITLFNASLDITTTLYKEGQIVDQSFEVFIVPIVSLLIFFLLVFFSAGFMLTSVAEEKENRMIETVLSIVSSRQLIWGKIIGLMGVAITQLFALIILFSVVTLITTNIFPITIDWSAISISPWQIITAIFYIFTGFLFLASVMVGVGAVMPTHREAHQFSAIFIMLTILPIYFATILIAEPAGTLARVISFTPFTAPLILLFRSSFGAMTTLESILGMVVVIIYVIIGFYLAFRLFEIGSLETTKKISIFSIFKKK